MVVLAHRTTDSKWGLECVELWRIGWRLTLLMAQCFDCGAQGCGVYCGIGWCQNNEGVPTQHVGKHEGVALNEAIHRWS